MPFRQHSINNSDQCAQRPRLLSRLDFRAIKLRASGVSPIVTNPCRLPTCAHVSAARCRQFRLGGATKPFLSAGERDSRPPPCRAYGIIPRLAFFFSFSVRINSIRDSLRRRHNQCSLHELQPRAAKLASEFIRTGGDKYHCRGNLSSVAIGSVQRHARRPSDVPLRSNCQRAGPESSLRPIYQMVYRIPDPIFGHVRPETLSVAPTTIACCDNSAGKAAV